jgi:hypothetical protein
MDADLQPVVAALAHLADGELAALIEASNGVPQTAPGLLAWIEGVCDWEQNRRRGLDFPLLPHDAAIPPGKDAVSFGAAAMLRALFAQDDVADTRTVIGMFDAIVGPPSGGVRCSTCAKRSPDLTCHRDTLAHCATPRFCVLRATKSAGEDQRRNNSMK